MTQAPAESNNNAFRDLPSIDELLRSPTGVGIAQAAGAGHAAKLAREAVDRIRDSLAGRENAGPSQLLEEAGSEMTRLWNAETLNGFRRVINATGVIIHTNLGRAPLSAEARAAMLEAASYCTLEYDLETGKRGRRGKRCEELLIELTGAEDALLVNNCAAAAFFVLNAFAAGGEVVISRGEIVEIGGDFRVPDVLERSGAVLREVGTTNRTKLSDYANAIGPDTRLLLRVHPSNYRIVGFSAVPTVPEIAGLAGKHGLLFYEDLGSGALVDLSDYGLKDEPLVSRSLADGADIVTFSGDKLLGGPQCGIIAGRAELIEKLRKHPLQRALRVDKKTFAALEATLDAYRRGTHFQEIPVLAQLALSAADIRQRAERLIAGVGDDRLQLSVIAGRSVVGGGAAPDVHPETALIAVSHKELSAEHVERRLRMSDPPVIARIEDGRVLLDLRTVDESEEHRLSDALASL